MARATTSSRTRSTRATEPAPKKRLGRPVGSKNRVPSAAKAKTRAAPVPAPRRTAARKAAPAAPKLNKAELEAQVVKLERTVARLRKQNTELKQAARDEPVEAPKAAAPVVADKKPKRAAATRGRRSKPSVDVDVPATESDEAEPSDD